MKGRIFIAEIQAAVAHRYRLPVAEMTSARRDREAAWPRQVAMYLSKQLSPLSLPQIGRRFNRDHTTVIFAVRQVAKRRSTDADLDEDLRRLARKLRGEREPMNGDGSQLTFLHGPLFDLAGELAGHA